MTRVSLGDLIRGGIPEPERICGGRLYAGQVHLLAGEPEAGKTTLALSWALELIRCGGVAAVLDEESGARQIARRLAALGATADEADQIEYHEFPAPDLTFWQRQAEAMTEAEPGGKARLIVVDSAAAAMVRAGLAEDSNTDATRLWQFFIAMARSPLCPAVLVTDHLAKAQPDARYSRGASAKLASSDVMYRLDQVRPFTREEAGVVRLVVTKDREGCLRRATRLRVATAGQIAFAEEEAPATPGEMPPAMAKLYAALDGEARSITNLTDRIAAAHGHGLYRTTASRELAALERAGLARRHGGGPGKPVLWSREHTASTGAGGPRDPLGEFGGRLAGEDL